jgi:outer membrane protein insertion porin family
MWEARNMRFWAFVWLFGVSFVGVSSGSLGQEVPSLTGTLSEIRVEGTTDYELLVRTVIRSRPGVNVDSINVETERNLVYNIGTFSQVSVNLESQPAGFVLVIRVRENPRIAEVRVVGSSFPEENWLDTLASSELLEPGIVLNSTYAERARTTIQTIYREQAGFPFDVPVVLSITPQTPETQEAPPEESETPEEGEDPEAAEETPAPPPTTTDLTTIPEGTPVILTYTVTENVPLREIVFEGSTILEESLLNNFFDTLEQKREFNPQDYTVAVEDVAAAYRERGYRGSGVDRTTTTLVDGVLTVRLRELRILSFDTTAIGVDESEFSLKRGDLYNFDVLLEDIKRISAGRDTDIVLEPLELASGIRVAFRSGPPASAGEITGVTIEGNTVIPTEELLPLLSQNVGDNFTSALANEDFSEINRLYRERGYLIRVDEPNKFNYLSDGTYIIRISEYTTASYRIIFDKENPKTKEYVITRYLPDPGSIYNQEQVRNGLTTVARLGGVVPVSATPQPNPDDPTSVIVEIAVREQPTAQFRPELSYTTSATSSEFVGRISFGDTNFLGEAHDFNAELNAQTSDLGFMFGGSVNYRIPWIYNNDPYYRERPTSFGVSLFSTVEDDQRLTSDGAASVCYNFDTSQIEGECADTEKVSVGQYTTRENGVSFRVGRQILPSLNLSFSARTSYAINKLEPDRACDFNSDEPLADQNCTLPYNAALEFLPQGGVSASLGMALAFDNRDNPNFPKEGVSADASVGLGLGNDYRNPETDVRASYAYVPLEFGVRTYVQLQDIFPEVNNPNHVFAFKVNLGHQFGGDYPRNRYFSVGDSQLNDKLIRGFDSDDTNLSKTYGIGTIEYRYDFGFDSFATETIIGLVFTDVGWVSSMPGFDDYGTPIIAGAGLGVQLNLNIAGIGLPAIRLDYSFSERNPTGIFRFRFGPVF